MGGRTFIGKIQHISFGFRSESGGDFVAAVEDQRVIGMLIQVNVSLGVDIFLIALVYIQMIRCDICDHGNMRTLSHGMQLKAGKFQHHKVLRCDLIDDRQQRRTNVAAQENLMTAGFQHFSDQCGRCGFSVTARHGNGLGGRTECEENLHLRGYRAALGARADQFRHIKTHAWGLEDQLLGKIL